ncbi:FecR domain-containing protein [Echinicola sediminis]
MDHIDIHQIISKTLSGEANAEEILLLKSWLEKDERNRREFEMLKNIWKNTLLKDEYSNKSRVYQNFLKKKDFVDAHQGKTTSTSLKSVEKTSRTAHRKWLGYAAAIGIFFLVGLAYHMISTDTPPRGPEKRCMTVKQNPKGQKSKIVLSDGTIVWLNSDSEISYYPGFSDSLRVVNLLGEAYFQVAKDRSRPFVVKTGAVSTTALGTEFNVNYYPESKLPTIFLAEGKVKIEENTDLHITEFLNPGWALGPLSGEENPQPFRDIPEKWISWRNGILQFHKADLETVLKKCERWYNVEIKVEGTIPPQWNFTGKFKNEYLENVLISMNYGKDFNYKIQDDMVTLTFN